MGDIYIKEGIARVLPSVSEVRYCCCYIEPGGHLGDWGDFWGIYAPVLARRQSPLRMSDTMVLCRLHTLCL